MEGCEDMDKKNIYSGMTSLIILLPHIVIVLSVAGLLTCSRNYNKTCVTGKYSKEIQVIENESRKHAS